MTPRTLRGSVWTTANGHAAVKLLVLILGTYTVVMVCLALTAVKLVLIPVLIAVLLAAAISPLVHFLEGRSIPKTAATLISLVAGLLLLGALAAAAGYSIYRQWNELLVNSDAALARLEQMITQSPLPFSAQDLRQARQDAIRSVTADLSVGDAIAAINTLGTFVTGLLLMIVVLFFFLKDGRKIWLFLVRAAPR
jgi:predicted PurR-regulated permease PerM